MSVMISLKKVFIFVLFFSMSINLFAETITTVAPTMPYQQNIEQFQKSIVMRNRPKDYKMNYDSGNQPSQQMIFSSTQPSLLIVPPEVGGPTQGGTLTFAQSQEAMLNAAPPFPAPSEESSEAFKYMMQQNMPLTPQQVVRLRQLIDISQRAAAVPANIPPKPVSSTLLVNLAPGATPSVIRLAQGYVSSLVFIDSTGAPWPIASYDIGDPKSVNIQWDGKSNILLIQAVSPYGAGNLVVRLMDLPTPISLELISGQRFVDYRADIHIPGIGPNSKNFPIASRLPDNANQVLLNILEGIAPPGSKLLTVRGGSSQAWLVGDTMYLRTRMTVLSPGWIGKMVSPDGMNAYEIQRASSVLVSQYGKPVALQIEGF